jgi:hypothetical protein
MAFPQYDNCMTALVNCQTRNVNLCVRPSQATQVSGAERSSLTSVFRASSISDQQLIDSANGCYISPNRLTQRFPCADSPADLVQGNRTIFAVYMARRHAHEMETI